MKKSNIITLVVLIAILLTAALLTAWLTYKKNNAVLDETVAIFSNQPGEAPYSDLLGNPVRLDEYLGKVLVVVSWASWSPFSQADLLMMNELASRYSSDQVAFLAINRKETKEQAARYVSTIPTLSNVVIVLDPRDHFYGAVSGYAMPEAVIYNQRGEVVQHYRGVASKVDIETILNNLTKEQ